MTDSFAWDRSMPPSEQALVKEDGETVECKLILMSDIPTKLPALPSAAAQPA